MKLTFLGVGKPTVIQGAPWIISAPLPLAAIQEAARDAALAVIPTTEALQDLVAAMFAGGHANATVTYNDPAGTLTIAATGTGGAGLSREEVEDFVSSLIVGGTGISAVYNDGAGTLTLSLAGESFTAAHKAKLDALTGDVAPQVKSLLIYYGYPIAYKGMWNVQDVVDAIANDYDIYIVGDTYQYPSHETYATTVEILAGLKARGVTLFGYVPIGVSTVNLTMAEMQARVDLWKDLGVHGIFLDEFGFDYQVSRSRQVEIVNYCHAQGLNYCANAWIWWDVGADHANQLPAGWAQNDWRRTQFLTGNPDNLTLPRTPGDAYLFESLGFSQTGMANFWDVHDRLNDAIQSNTDGLALWAVGVLKESAPGVPDFSATPPFATVDQAASYLFGISHAFGLDAAGIGGYSYGSSSSPITIRRKIVPPYFGAALGNAVIDRNSFTSTRSYEYGQIALTTDAAEGIYQVSLKSDVIDAAHEHPVDQVIGLVEALGDKADKTDLPEANYTNAEKLKLASIAGGATANAADEHLLTRQNHTGTQDIATVNGLQGALDAIWTELQALRTLVSHLDAGISTVSDDTIITADTIFMEPV